MKVIEVHAPMVARATGVSEDRVIAGLVRLWHRCWSTTTDKVSRRELAGAFGADSIDALCEALVGEFLDVCEGEPGWYKVRGADTYLRVKASRAEGARATNAQRRFKSVREREVSVQGAALNRALPDALSPNTEHRAPNTISTTTKEPSEQEASGAVAFWRFFMDVRQQETQRIPEAPPHPAKLGRWYSDAMMELGGSDEALREAIRGYGSDPYWREAGYPFAGFAKQWRKYATAAKGN